HPVGQVGDHLRRRRVERGEVELDGVGQVQGGVREGRERRLQRRLERAVDLYDVEVPDPRSEVLAQNAEPAPDLEHDVFVVQLGRPADDAEDVVVDQEVLTQ